MSQVCPIAVLIIFSPWIRDISFISTELPPHCLQPLLLWSPQFTLQLNFVLLWNDCTGKVLCFVFFGCFFFSPQVLVGQNSLWKSKQNPKQTKTSWKQCYMEKESKTHSFACLKCPAAKKKGHRRPLSHSCRGIHPTQPRGWQRFTKRCWVGDTGGFLLGKYGMRSTKTIVSFLLQTLVNWLTGRKAGEHNCFHLSDLLYCNCC